jgi:phosphohistidine phosphatase
VVVPYSFMGAAPYPRRAFPGHLVYSSIVQIILIRHAAAVDETLELRDPYRHLTPHGREQARRLGDRLRWHDCAPTILWTSPLARAVQTAELLAGALESSVCVECVPALAPDGSPRDVAAAARAQPTGSTVMLVGHEPSLSAIGAVLVGAPDFEGLAKAEAARIVDGVLRWRFAWDAEAPTIAAPPR